MSVELKPCPLLCALCGKPLDVQENGRACCRNLIEIPDTYAEWAEGSCAMAVYSVQLPIEVWEQLSARTVPVAIEAEQKKESKS